MKPSPSAKSAAAPTAARQRARARSARPGPFVWVAVAVAVVLAVVAAILFATRTTALEALDSEDWPQNVNPDGGLSFGQSFMPGTGNDGAPVVAVFADYTCEFCHEFDQTHSAYISEALLAGELTYVVYPVAILDGSSDSSGYSTRAASAIATVAAEAPEYTLPMHEGLIRLFAEWRAMPDPDAPEEPGDEDIAEFATLLGVPEDVVDKLDDGSYTSWVQAATADFEALELPGTPAVFVDGHMLWDWQENGALARAVQAAAAASPAPER